MRKSTILLSCIGLTCASYLNATILHHWSFDEPAGTDITDTINSASPGSQWSGWNSNNLQDITGQTTGAGTLRIESTVTARESRVLVGDTGGAETLFLHTRISSWEMTDSTQIRLGFVSNDPIFDGSSIYAETRLDLLSDNTVAFESRALGTGATNSPSSGSLFSNIMNDPLDIVLGVNSTTNRYTVHYRVGADAWVDFFEGDLNASRQPLTFRIYSTTGGNGELVFDIDSVTLSTVNPIPEPQTYALMLGLAAIGFVYLRRRKNKCQE